MSDELQLTEQIQRFLQQTTQGDRGGEDRLLGRLALESGAVTLDALRECLNEQSEAHRRGEELRLFQILLKRRLIDTRELLRLLEELKQLGAGAPRLERYEVLQKLGSGGAATVYLARDRELGREVALKVLNQTSERFRERFRREARLLASLSHPHVIGAYDSGQTGEQAYLVLELVRGQTLAEQLADRETLLLLLEQAARGVAAAHAAGIVHRDLKPANILVTPEGQPKVADFGLARPSDEEDGLTLTGAVLGTPRYMAPEQVRGEEATARTDVWALGVMLYEMLAGRLPFTAPAAPVLMWKIAHEDPALPRRLPRELQAICLKALEKDPAKRYADAGEFAEELRRYREDEPVLARPPGAIKRMARWTRRHRAAAAAGATMLISVLAALIGIGLQLKVARQKAREARQAQAAEARERRKVAERLADFESMADVRRVVELQARYEALGPQGWKVAAMKSWLEQARQMRGRLKTHRQIVNRLASKRSRSETEEWQLQVVRQLIPRIEPLVAGIPLVERWLRDAPWNKWRRQTIEQQGAAWRKASAAIQRHPKYGGLVLAPQEGLVPLGPDPASHLWEFVLLPSGAMPVRGANGRWQITGDTGMVLVLIPGGRFRMGSDKASDTNSREDERPAHFVTLAHFFLSKYELTQGQWRRMTGKNPSKYKPLAKIRGLGAFTLAHPVEQVSWYESSRTLQRWGLELPAEAQWEYAARAGTRTIWWPGNDKSALKQAGNLADLALRQAGGLTSFVGWNDGHVVHAPVGRFAPNAFGLHDCVGNVWEWCRDAYDERAYRRKVDRQGVREENPSQQLEGARTRVHRGGGWTNTAVPARSASRNRSSPDLRGDFRGVRPARRIVP